MRTIQSKPALTAALASIAANPLLAHMRKVAYSPVDLSEERRPKGPENELRLYKAQQKRIRKSSSNQAINLIKESTQS